MTDKKIWKNHENLSKLYNDETFGIIAAEIHKIIEQITQEMAVHTIETTSTLKKLTGKVGVDNIKEMFKHVAGNISSSDIYASRTLDSTQKEEMKSNEKANTDHLLGIEDDQKPKTSKYAFWNISVYNSLKKAFAINSKAKETYLWSFLLSIACCIV